MKDLFAKVPEKVRFFVIALAVIGGTFGFGVYVGQSSFSEIEKVYSLENKEEGKPEKTDFAPFWKAWNLLSEKYVATQDDNPVTDEQRVYGAIQGLAASLGDPYTVFFPPEETKSFQEEINGNFEGVGMEVGEKDGVITVIAPLKGTPAEKAGVRSGDKILEIDGTSTRGVVVDEAIKLIRGKSGTTVTLTVLRGEEKETRSIEIVRAVIDIPTVDYKKLSEEKVFVISIYNFSSNASTLFRNALKEFTKSGYHKLVIDVRGNPGGYLEAAVDMASWFLPEGKVIVSEDTGGKGENKVYRSKGYDIFNHDVLKVVVLIDEGSASASEILAGALSEHGVAELVGTHTFGKGSVQELVRITPDTSLKVTIARWLTPNGNSISDGGLKADVEVEFTDEGAKNGVDPQFQKALEVLNAE